MAIDWENAKTVYRKDTGEACSLPESEFNKLRDMPWLYSNGLLSIHPVKNPPKKAPHSWIPKLDDSPKAPQVKTEPENPLDPPPMDPKPGADWKDLVG